MTPIKTPAGEILPLRLPKESKAHFVHNGHLNYNMPFSPATESIRLPEGNWQILGPIIRKYVAHHEDPIGHYELEFGFDPEPFVDVDELWNLNWTCDYQEWLRQEFLKLIESQGEILWSNPMGEKPMWKGGIGYGISTMDIGLYNEEVGKWKQYQDKLVKDTELIFNLVNR